MDQYNRKELSAIVEKQQDKLKKYEAKIRDVVAAYKGLLNEKTALEATVKSLSHNVSRSASVAENTRTNSSETKENLNQEEDFVDPLNAKGCKDDSSKFRSLNEQISTLTKALSTVTEEKSRMEASFQADKKKLRLEKEELENKLKEEQENCKTSDKSSQKQIQELKDKLRNQQYNHEREQSNQQIMLRELQNRINDERITREKLETELEEAQLTIAIKESQPSKTDEYEKEILTLKNELLDLQTKLKESEEKLNHPSPLLLELQREMAELKIKQQANVEEEEQRINETVQRLMRMAKASENRAAELETRVADLSETVGRYERQRQQDLATIQRLKERISHLDAENSALSRAASCLSQNASWEKESDELSLDVDGLIEKITKLKELLKKAKEKSKRNSISEFLNNDFELHSYQSSSENVHDKCQNELQQLREEFEQYKLCSQSIFKNNKKDHDSNKEMEMLRTQIKDLKQKISSLKAEMMEAEQNYISTVTVLRSSTNEQKANHKQQLASLEADWKAKLVDVESQLQKQRERSLSLLEEKDKEIFFLKSQLNPRQHMIRKLSHTYSEKVSQPHNDNDTNSEEMVNELSGSVMIDKKEAQFLHYMQEMARKDVEISNLRRAKHQLEINLREMQLDYASKEDAYNKNIEELNNKILRLERNSSREGANLEYLKNVVLSYMISSSATSRHHMLNAIAAVLKFTQKESDCVKEYNSRWW